LARSPVNRFGLAFVALAISLGIGLTGCSAATPASTATPQATATSAADAVAQAHIDAAKVALKAGKFDEAIREAQAATTAEPQSSDAQWVLGNAYNQMADTQSAADLRQNTLSKAVDAYLQALKLNPNSDATYTNLATVYYKTGQFDEAQKQVEQALKINPTDATSHYVLGTIYLQRNPKDYPDALDKAQAEFEAAVQRDPKLGAAYIGLANVYLARNDSAKALQNAQKGVELTQDAPDPFVYWALAQAQSATGDKAGCTKTIEKINNFKVAAAAFNQQLQKLTQQCK
jgi:tetratricopeptide (TPR) repeat protein